MIYDVVTYNGEKELFDLRYNILKDYVDEFRVIEFNKTFSGKDKKWLFNNFDDEKIVYYQIREEDYEKYRELAESSPNTIGAEHWTREFMQKESIKDCLIDLLDEDIVYIGDCDEIWLCPLDPIEPVKLKLEVYTYWLNNRSNEQFWGTLCANYGMIKGECLNHLRANARKTENILGWHFTSMKPYLKQKLLDSYTEETYANKQVMDNLVDNIAKNKDFLGRDFKYWLGETNWPAYLTQNRHKFKHLIKNYENTQQ